MVISTAKLSFFIKTNIAFSSRLFAVNFQLNLQRKKIKTEPGEKKGKVLPSDNNSSNKTDYPRETEPGEKRKGKVLPSDNNSSHTNDKTRKKFKNEGSSLTEINQVIKD